MKNTLQKVFLVVMLVLGMQTAGWGQTSISAMSVYTQNFNTLVSTGSGTWTNNSTLEGWYARTTATASITSANANTGSTTTAGLYSYGTASDADRALGFATTNTFTGAASSGKNFLGWRFVNNTGQTISRITIVYDGEQWRRDHTVGHSLDLSYQIGASVTDLVSGTWTSIATASFTSPNIVGTGAALDGNASGNRVANISHSIAVTLNNAQEVMIRWEDLNDSGNDQVLTIDNVRVSFSGYSDRQITGTAGWRMLSAPKASFTVADISDDTAIQGVAGGSNAGSSANFLVYKTGSFATPTDVNTTFGDGYGFITYFYDNATAGSSELPVTLDVTGAEPGSNVAVTLNTATAESGSYYTLAGNPFASNLTLSSITNNGNGIGANVVIHDNTIGLEGEYVDMATSTGVVAAWQGFWVSRLTTGTATSITIPTSGKTATSATASYFGKTVSAPVEGSMTLHFGGKVSAPFNVRLMEGAELGMDVQDAAKFTPLSAKYAIVGGRQVGTEYLRSIEALPSVLTEKVTIALETRVAGVSGSFDLVWSGYESFPAGYSVVLTDMETNQTYDLKTAGKVSFTASAKVADKQEPIRSLHVKGSTNPRFLITIDPASATSSEPSVRVTELALSQNYPNPFNPTTAVRFSLPSATNVVLGVYDVNGRLVDVIARGMKAAGEHTISWNAAGRASGVYMLKLEAQGQVLTRKMTLLK
jgi:hypothetical protein